MKRAQEIWYHHVIKSQGSHNRADPDRNLN